MEPRLVGWKARAARMVVGAASLGALGCASDSAMPRMRLGSIPFPGVLTLYATADPERLGTHRYEGWWSGGQFEEAPRGILYTCRAGFLDLSHIREYADWVKYLHERILPRLRRSGGEFDCEWSGAVFRVQVRAPNLSGVIDADTAEGLLSEASIAAACRTTVIIATWHEVATWFGYQTILGISEADSAFTWDDMTSHLVAAIVGERALRSERSSWDDAVTEALDQTLRDLEVVSVEDQARAVELVRGSWWLDGLAQKRDLESGLDSGLKRPWLVPEFDRCAGDRGVALLVPSLERVRGVDARSWVEVRIMPSHSMLRRATGCSDCPESIDPESALGPIMERVREQMLAKWGEGFDRP